MGAAESVPVRSSLGRWLHHRFAIWSLLLLGQIAIFFASASWDFERTGFTAISDDDYARVVIAQEFAEDPRLDPSGTSWLPLPFWITGAVMRGLSPSLETARLAAWGLALLASVLLYAAARRLELSRVLALALAWGLSLLPTLRPLAISPVPEYWCATLLAWGSVSLLGGAPLRLTGALAFFLACASRYEAWPAAFGFSACCAWDALVLLRRGRTTGELGRSHREPFGLLASALLGASFPALWMLHGALHQGSMWFFIRRVVEYKTALGLDPRSAFELLFGYPGALFGREPELTLGVLALGIAAAINRKKGLISSDYAERSPLLRLLIPSALLLFVLVLGDVRGGAPTHHPERALLSVWMVLALCGAKLLTILSRKSRRLALGLALLVALPIRFFSAGHYYADRRDEEDIGRLVREAIPTRAQVLLATTDYGYFAIQAAAGSPQRFTVLDSHDPRAHQALRPIPPRVLDTAEREGICWAVVPLCVEVPQTEVRAERGAFQLLRLERDDCRTE